MTVAVAVAVAVLVVVLVVVVVVVVVVAAVVVVVVVAHVKERKTTHPMQDWQAKKVHAGAVVCLIGSGWCLSFGRPLKANLDLIQGVRLGLVVIIVVGLGFDLGSGWPGPTCKIVIDHHRQAVFFAGLSCAFIGQMLRY